MVSNVASASIPGGRPGYCTGCAVCAAVCPQQAISIVLTDDGFYEPTVDDTKCADCGECEAICNRCAPATADGIENYVALSAKHRDRRVLRGSSSGGVSGELMRACLTAGYRVVGVAYDGSEARAVARIASSEDDLAQFSGSKYFQSLNMPAYEQVLNDRSGQRYAVFGTPCQVYGLAKAAERSGTRDKLILVDVFCHGCPSMNLWTRYLEYAKRKTGCSDFDQIEFRSKTYGWHEYAFVFTRAGEMHRSARIGDPFYALFFDKNVFNMACYDCGARSTLAFTDIRLGDFWGHQYDTDTEGVSSVILATERGRQLFARAEGSFELQSHTFGDAIRAQSYGRRHPLDAVARMRQLAELSSDAPLSTIARDEHRRHSIQWKIRSLLKDALRLLPRRLYVRLRKLVHQGGLS